MNKLQDFIWDYGTDGVKVVIETILRESTISDDYKKVALDVADRLADALREIPRKKMSVDEVKDLMLNYNW